jgi:1,2-dihydroxy-3-keto-5-methylthiopentene dioxygenase
MAIVGTGENVAIHHRDEVGAFLASHAIEYQRWARRATVSASAEAILAAYRAEIDAMKARDAYVAADVIDVTASTPNLDMMLQKFNREHWHDEDEVRFVVEGRGLFHVHHEECVFRIEVEAGDMIRVPRGTLHWFDLCADRRICAIRLFRDPSGWTPYYTDTRVETAFEPVCFGPAYFPVSSMPRSS